MLIQAVVLPVEDPMIILVKVGGILLFGLTAVLIGRLREVREAPFVAAALGVVALWRACQFGVILGSPPPVSLFFMSLGQAAVAFIPPSLLLGQAVGSGLIRPNRRNVLLLYSVAIVNVVLVATNGWHGLVWTHPPLRDGFILKRPDYGLWFNWFYTPFSYTLVVLALVAALLQLWSPIQMFRRQAALFLVSVTLPFANNIIFTYGGTPPNQMTTDLVFLGSGMLWAFGLLRLQLYRMSPMAQEAILSSITDGVLILGTADTLVDINPAARTILGLDHRAALGRPAEQALAGQPELIALSQNADPCSIVFRTLGGRTVEAEVRPVESSLGSIGGKLLVLRDTTERLQAQRDLQAREALLKTIVDNSPNGILTARPCGGEAGWPRDFECVQANPAAHRYLGLERLQGLRLSETPLVHKALLVQLLRSTVLRQETASVVIDAPAQGRWFQLVSSPAGSDALVTLVDITDQKTREQHISTIANLDPLTELFNRRGFEADAEAVLDRLAATRQSVAVLYFDLDAFKEANDTFGHAAGDAVLKLFADRLRHCFRDNVLLARIGGDEFVALMPEVPEGRLSLIATRAKGLLDVPYEVNGGTITCPVSIGTAWAAASELPLAQILDRADRAMLIQKGRNRGSAGNPTPAGADA